MSKYTPGPWHVADKLKIVVNSDAGNTIVACPGGDHNPTGLAEIQANARLIAAAPQLAEALKGLFENCAMTHKYWGDGDNSKESDAAIALARAALALVEGK